MRQLPILALLVWIAALSGLCIPVSAQNAPAFSHEGGYYTTSFELTLSVPEGEIRYTLDGSEPSTSSALYTGPLSITPRDGDPNVFSAIPTNVGQSTDGPWHVGWKPPAGEVFKITIVRARTFVSGVGGPIASRSFIVDPAGNQRFNLPVISIITEPDNLFDDAIGIYVPGIGEIPNYEQRGDEWERPAHFEFYEFDGSLAVSQDVGIRIHGATSRTYGRKSLRVYARAEYGESWINYPILPQQPVSRYKRLILRNAGQDHAYTMMRDGILQSLLRGMSIRFRDYRPTLIFINGEYWGIHDIRDRHDDRYFETHFGIDPDDIIILELNGGYSDGNEAGRQHYLDMLGFIEANSLTDPKAFQHVETMMDTDSFIDQVIANVFVMNTDWPGNNIDFWRKVVDEYEPDALYGHDGRWRWLVNDLDFGFGLHEWIPGGLEGAAHNTLAFALMPDGTEWPNQAWATFLFRKLVENDDFRTRFINRFADMLNTRFTPQVVLDAINSTHSLLQPEVAEHIHRWQYPLNVSAWENNVNVMRNFAQERPQHVRQHIRDVFELPGTAVVTLSVVEIDDDGQSQSGRGGGIQVNTIRPDMSSSWQGVYFQSVPIEIIARPDPGYRLVEWTGSIETTTDTLNVTLNSNLTLVAHFEYTGDFTDNEMNPVPFDLSEGNFTFTYWSPDEPELSFPDHMVFQQTILNDPGLNDEMVTPYFIPHNDYHADDQDNIGFPYGLTGRTRLTGLGEEGISFINTGRGRDLGAAVVALNARGRSNITVTWIGGTVNPQSREYRLRLQYRVGMDETFQDVLDSNGAPVEYVRNEMAGHEQTLGPFVLPARTADQTYVQVRWKHYYTGIGTSGPRDELRLDDILITTTPVSTEPELEQVSFVLKPNFPNPFSGTTTIPFELERPMYVSIEIINVLGQRVAHLVDDHMGAGAHSIEWTGSVAAGVYFYRMTVRPSVDSPATRAQTRRMVVF